ncbi:hypothetical protein TNCV_4055281 [Trichonephila clavipes]|nr:hypothetical protein TNCV_4055281 [Trichonephila clavipes]
MPAAYAAKSFPSEGQYRNSAFHTDYTTQTSRSKQLGVIAQKINTVDGIVINGFQKPGIKKCIHNFWITFALCRILHTFPVKARPRERHLDDKVVPGKHRNYGPIETQSGRILHIFPVKAKPRERHLDYKVVPGKHWNYGPIETQSGRILHTFPVKANPRERHLDDKVVPGKHWNYGPIETQRV